jgi:hypothetical protein
MTNVQRKGHLIHLRRHSEGATILSSTAKPPISTDDHLNTWLLRAGDQTLTSAASIFAFLHDIWRKS